jgi:AraC-like DNA-binding protein
MVKTARRQNVEASAPNGVAAGAFSEIPAWRGVGDGWRVLHGSIAGAGVSFEWHDFIAERELDWGRSFHPGSVEVCMNLAGEGRVSLDKNETLFAPLTAGFYRQGDRRLVATRSANQRHQFLTVEMSFDFLGRQLGKSGAALHPLVREAVAGRGEKSTIAPTLRLTSRQQQLMAGLRAPPVLAGAQPVWYQAKALEVAAEFFFAAPDEEELFCQRHHRLAAERSEKVIALLRERLAEPPTLEELGRAAGCSPFHLSRTFSMATGMTIPQYLRQLRMERAAELLRSGKFNVTETAMEVGYSSPGHFTTAFRETFGCCPGLYPVRTPR